MKFRRNPLQHHTTNLNCAHIKKEQVNIKLKKQSIEIQLPNTTSGTEDISITIH